MVFCTNCGQRIGVSMQAEIPTAPKVQLTNSAQRPMAAAPPKNNSKLWIGGLLGCLGLFFLGGIGIVGLIAVSNFSAVNIANTPANNNSGNPDNRNYPWPPFVDEKTLETGAQNELLDIFNDKKEIGKFRQTVVNAVPKKDYFPFANGAALATYHNGSRYVTVAIGKFKNFEEAKKNFDDQFANTKKNGGKIQVLPVGKDGTINGVYQIKKNYYAEYCTTSAFCYRMVSTDAIALKNFIENFVTF